MIYSILTFRVLHILISRLPPSVKLVVVFMFVLPKLLLALFRPFWLYAHINFCGYLYALQCHGTFTATVHGVLGKLQLRGTTESAESGWRITLKLQVSSFTVENSNSF